MSTTLTVKAKTDRVRTQALLAEYGQTRSRAVRDELVVLHEKLVRFIAIKFTGRGEPVEDLFQVGLMGLVKAIERYDVSHGAQFASFAMPTIVGEIKRYFRDHGSALKISRHIKELMPSVLSAVEHNTQQTKAAPTAAALAEKLHITEERVLEVLEAARTQRMVSLDAPASESSCHGLGSLDKDLVEVENQMMVQAAFGALTDRERVVIYGRFFQQQSQSDIAKIIGVSQMHVCRMERAALQKMKVQLQHVAA